MNVSTSLNAISKTLHENQNGWYTANYDLDELNLPSGNYTIDVKFSKKGYLISHYQVPLEILKRKASISVVKERNSVKSNDNLKLQIYINDEKTNNFLERPVRIELSIYLADTIGANNKVYYSITEGVIQNFEKTWKVPQNLEDVECDLELTLYSEYYDGYVKLENFITIQSPLAWWIIVIPSVFAMGGVSVGLYYFQEKIKRSLLGIICLHNNGMPLAERMEELGFNQDVVLISAAITGITSIIKEITGSNTRVIEIEGGYMSLTKRDGYWMILFLQKNPRFIQPTILNFIQDFENEYITPQILLKKKPILVDFDKYIQKYFHKTLQPHMTENYTPHVSIPE